MSKRTDVAFFCSAIHRYSTYKLILEMPENKKVNVVSCDHFIKERIKQEKVDPKPKMELLPKE